MKNLIIILSILLPFFLAYLIKNKDLNLTFVSVIIFLFCILVVSYLTKNNQKVSLLIDGTKLNLSTFKNNLPS